MIREKVTSACPSCGDVATRETYDIGSGPELSCATCEWCWGAGGQKLKPLAPFAFPGPLPGDPAIPRSPKDAL